MVNYRLFWYCANTLVHIDQSIYWWSHSQIFWKSQVFWFGSRSGKNMQPLLKFGFSATWHNFYCRSHFSNKVLFLVFLEMVDSLWRVHIRLVLYSNGKQFLNLRKIHHFLFANIKYYHDADLQHINSKLQVQLINLILLIGTCRPALVYVKRFN